MEFSAKTPARDQDQPLGALRELVGELHRHPSAERMSDERASLLSEHLEKIAEDVRISAERVVTARLRRFAVSKKIGRDDSVVRAKSRNHLFPGNRAPRNAMKEYYERTAPSRPIEIRLSVQIDARAFQLELLTTLRDLADNTLIRPTPVSN